MKIETVGINQNVCAPGGHVGRVVEISQNGQVRLDFGPNNFHYVPFFVGDIEPVSDPCQGCQKLESTRLKAFWEGRAAGDISADKKIASIDESCGYWKAACEEARRNATYWREELAKLQKEALAECATENSEAWRCAGGYVYEGDRPLSEVAKCYKQVAPEKLLMSDDARTICELLEGSGPMTSSQIASRLHLLERCILESITEARDAGRISLVNGKYEIARD
jgi:hypothetical protein